MKEKVCLITGATGFIGQHAVSELVADGRKVIALGGPEANYCPAVLRDHRLKVTEGGLSAASFTKKNEVLLQFGEISDPSFLANLFAEIEKKGWALEFVLHFAACSTIQQAIGDKEGAWRTNYDGTKALLEESLRYYRKYPDVFKGFFYASTDKVYGEGSSRSYQETDDLKPLPYPYDQSKAAADAYVREAAKEYALPVVVYRFCNVYGPGDYHVSRIVPGSLYRLIYRNEAPLLKVYTDSAGVLHSFYRDMIYVKDLTKAISLLLHRLEKANDIPAGEVFNLGTENCYAMREVIATIMRCVGSVLVVQEEEVKTGEIKKQCMNYAKLEQWLGFKPQYTLERGLQETVAWYLRHKEEINGKFG